MSEITDDIMAGAPIIPVELWLISCDGQASFKWSLPMVESYLPNIITNIARVSTLSSSGLFFQSHAGAAIGIMLDGVSSDVLTKIDEYIRYFCHQIHVLDYNTFLLTGYLHPDWLVNFLSNLDADMMKKLKSETEKRRVQFEAAGAKPRHRGDTPMQLLADLTADLCVICVDQQLPEDRALRIPEYDIYLTRVVEKIRQERGKERGYFGNV